MRIRTIKPEFWSHEDISELDAETTLLLIGLFNYADDEGYFRANESLIRSAIFPLRECSVSIHGALIRFEKMGIIEMFLGDDQREYCRFINWRIHQRINRPTPSKIRDLHPSLNAHGGLTEDSLLEGKGREGKGKDNISNEQSMIDFDSFWKVYPRKISKAAARKAWLAKNGSKPPIDEIIAAVEKQSESEQWRNAKFIPHPATWLNGERWSDEPEPANRLTPAAPATQRESWQIEQDIKRLETEKRRLNDSETSFNWVQPDEAWKPREKKLKPQIAAEITSLTQKIAELREKLRGVPAA